MISLGLNAFHADSAAALVIDGKLVAAVEEERFRRIKHWAGFPSESIAWCLAHAKIGLEEVDVIALNTDPSAARFARLAYGLRHLPSPQAVIDRLRARSQRMSVNEHLQRAFPSARIRARIAPVEHHLAHLASAFYPSGFERALALSVDGFGDFASAAWGMGEHGKLSASGKIAFPHSLGVYYQAMTQYLGFPHYGDEYKVMGLAPYGQPTFAAALRKIVQTDSNSGRYQLDVRYFRHHRERIAEAWDDGIPTFSTLYSDALIDLLGPARDPKAPITQRDMDLARSVQMVFEECYLGLIRALAKSFDTDTLVLAGGCAQNSVANGLIAAQTPFKRVYVAAAGYDAGGALGAAMVAAVRAGDRLHPAPSAYLGPAYSDAEVEQCLQSAATQIADAACTSVYIACESELVNDAAQRIAASQIIGWYQGALEWGPRALGNRSILGDPRRSDIKDIINRKIKRRESFRPFAPSILRECATDWFEGAQDVPYMSMVLPVRADRRAQIPAVTHVDGSGRLQTVDPEHNGRYAALIRAFHARTGVPILLNTSFNENEPVVCRPNEALQCMLRTDMDAVYLGNWCVSRTATPSA